jgi:hypothetical protein
MKKLFLFLTLSTTAMASGKITIQPNFWLKEDKVTPTIGFGIYEPIIKGHLAYNGWTGYGEQPQEITDAHWFTSKHDIDIYWDKLTISPGFTAIYILPYKKFQQNVHVKLGFQVW